MRVKLDYKQPPPVVGQPKNPTSQQLTSMYVQYAVRKKYPELKGQLMRLWGRLQRKFDEAVDEDLETIELETSEKEFIQKCFSGEVGFPAEIAKFVMILQDEIDQLK